MANTGALFSAAVSAAAVGSLSSEASTYLNQSLRVAHKTRQDMTDSAFNELRSSSYANIIRGAGSKKCGSDHTIFFESRRFAQSDLLDRIFVAQASGAYVVKPNADGKPLRVAFLCAADRELKYTAGNDSVHMFIYDAAVRDMKRTETIRSFASTYAVNDQLYYACRSPASAYCTAGSSRLHLFKKPEDLPDMEFDVVVVLDGVYYITPVMWGVISARIKHRICYVDFMAPPELVHFDVQDAQPGPSGEVLHFPQMSEFYELTARPYVDPTAITYKSKIAARNTLKGRYAALRKIVMVKASQLGAVVRFSDDKHTLETYKGEAMTECAHECTTLDTLWAQLQAAEKRLKVNNISDLVERVRTWLDKETAWSVELTMLDCRGTHANSYTHDLETWRCWMGAGISTTTGDFVFTPMGHYYIHKFMCVNRAVGPEKNIVPNVLPKSWIMVRVVDISASVQSWWPHISESVTYQYVRLSEIMNVLSYVNSLTDETIYGDKAYATIVAAMRREHTSVNFTNSVVQEPLAKLGVMEIASIAQTVLVWARYVRERRAEAVKEFTRTGVTAYIRKWFGCMFDDTIISTLIARLKRVKDLEGLIQVLPRRVSAEFTPSVEGVMQNTMSALVFDEQFENLNLDQLKQLADGDKDWADFTNAPSAPPLALEPEKVESAASESGSSSTSSVTTTAIDQAVEERYEDGQAKLYHAEWHFLKAIKAGPCQVVVHVVGAAVGTHYTHLAREFPAFKFVLYDKPGREIRASGINIETRSDYSPPKRKDGKQDFLYVLIDDHLDTTEEDCWKAAQARAAQWTPSYDYASLKLNPLEYPIESLRYKLVSGIYRVSVFHQSKKYYQGHEVRGFVGLSAPPEQDIVIPFEVKLKHKETSAGSADAVCPGRVDINKACTVKTKMLDGVRAFCDGCMTGSHVKHVGGWLCKFAKNIYPRMPPGSFECAGCNPKRLEFTIAVTHLTAELASLRDSDISVAKAASVFLDAWKDQQVSKTSTLIKMSGEFLNICGVPGSGKSRWLRKWALAFYLATQQRVAVVLPMQTLLADYRGTEEAIDDAGNIVRLPVDQFIDAKTRHVFMRDCSDKSYGAIAVDEVYTMSALEIWYLTRFQVPILLVGDHAQQHLADTHGYGWGKCMIDNDMTPGDWISHRFFLNYRNPISHLHLANMHYNRANEPLMVGMRPDPTAQIRVMTSPHELQAAYGRNGKSWRSYCTVMAFSKKGYAALLPDEVDKQEGKEPKINTVRSMQGATVDKPLVLIVDETFAASQGAVHTGTNIVAFTRHKHDLVVYLTDRAQATIRWVEDNGLKNLLEAQGLGAIGEVQEIKEPLPVVSTPETYAPPCNSAQLMLAEEPPLDPRHASVKDDLRDGSLPSQDSFSGRINQNLSMDLTPAGVVRPPSAIKVFSEGYKTISSTFLIRNSRQIMRTAIMRAGVGTSKPLPGQVKLALMENGRRYAGWIVGEHKSAPTSELIYDSLRGWIDDAKLRHYVERYFSAQGVALNDFKSEFERFQEIIRGNIKQGVKMINVQKLMNDFSERVNAFKPPTALAEAEMKKAGQMTATTNIALIIATAVYVRLFTRVMVSRMGKDYGYGIFDTSAYKSNEEIIECLTAGMRATTTFAVPHASYEDSSGMDSKSTKDYRLGPIAMLERMAELFSMPPPIGGFENMVERFNGATVMASNLKFTKKEELASGIVTTWLMTTAENMYNSLTRVSPSKGSFNYFTGDDAGRFQRIPFQFNRAGKALLDSSTCIKIVNTFNDGDGYVNKDPEPFIFELAGYSVYCDQDMSPSVGTLMLRKTFKFLQTPEVLPNLDEEAQALAVFKRLGPRINSLRDYVKFILDNQRVDVEVTHAAAFLRQDQPTVPYAVHRQKAIEVLDSLISIVRIKAVDYQAHGEDR